MKKLLIGICTFASLSIFASDFIIANNNSDLKELGAQLRAESIIEIPILNNVIITSPKLVFDDEVLYGQSEFHLDIYPDIQEGNIPKLCKLFGYTGGWSPSIDRINFNGRKYIYLNKLGKISINDINHKYKYLSTIACKLNKESDS